MKWKAPEKVPKRNEREWYPFFPLFFPVKISGYYYLWQWVEERFTGGITATGKIYEYREYSPATPVNGKKRVFNGVERLIPMVFSILLFITVWNYFH